ncbi:MAG: MFS transporter [Candidatus Binataceae bacterium]
MHDHERPPQPSESWPDQQAPAPSTRSLHGLDLANFFQADVSTGIGPYLAIYLMASQRWPLGRIGIAMGAQGIATVLAQTPMGAIVDATRHKRALMVAASAAVALGCIAFAVHPSFAVVIAAQVWIGIAAVAFAPALAAVSLGLVGHDRFPARMGRNESSNHAGNVFGAVVAGIMGRFISYSAIFSTSAAMSIATAASVLSIREREIDHRAARAALPDNGGHARLSGWRELLENRSLAIFAIAVILFHFANAAMLPLVGELLSSARHASPALDMSAFIVTAQIVMIPMAAFAGRYCSVWGRKPVLLIAFAVLPLRAVLYTLTRDSYLLVAIQALDGVGAGIFGVAWIIVVADLAEGTGRFNLIAGAISTGVAIGASLSNVMTGFVVQHAGFNTGFLVLGAIALAAFAVLALAMPETRGAGRPASCRSPNP